MNASHKQALRNERNLTIRKTGFGHWKVSCDYRGKRISTTTTNSVAVDDWNTCSYERNSEGYVSLRGYRTLCSEIIRCNKSNY